MSDETNSLMAAHADGGTGGQPAPQASPASATTLAEAYEQRRGGDPGGPSQGPERQSLDTDGGELEQDGKPRRKTLAQMQSDLASEAAKERERDRRSKPKSQQSLAEAYENSAPESVTPIPGLPSELRGYDYAHLVVVLDSLELDPETMDPQDWAYWADSIKERLDDALESETEESTETEDEFEENGEEEEQEEAGPEDEQQTEKTLPPLPKTLEELTVQQAQEVRAHMDAVYQRSQEINDPLMSSIFVHNLATALEATPETMPTVQRIAGVLQYGAQQYVEAALSRYVPSMMGNFLAENFGPILEAYAPGLAPAFREATCANLWDEICSMPEFADLKLPSFGSEEYRTAGERIYAANPWLNDFDPPGPNGEQLPTMDALRLRAVTVARLLAGERLSPKQVMAQIKDALESGKRSAQSNNRKVRASRSLGAGRTKGSFNEASERNEILDAFRSRRNSDGGVL